MSIEACTDRGSKRTLDGDEIMRPTLIDHDMWRRIRHIVRLIMMNKHAIYFIYTADVNLNMISKRLNANKFYPAPEAVYNDVKLMFTNALNANPSPTHLNAIQQLEALFEDRWGKMETLNMTSDDEEDYDMILVDEPPVKSIEMPVAEAPVVSLESIEMPVAEVRVEEIKSSGGSLESIEMPVAEVRVEEMKSHVVSLESIDMAVAEVRFEEMKSRVVSLESIDMAVAEARFEEMKSPGGSLESIEMPVAEARFEEMKSPGGSLESIEMPVAEARFEEMKSPGVSDEPVAAVQTKWAEEYGRVDLNVALTVFPELARAVGNSAKFFAPASYYLFEMSDRVFDCFTAELPEEKIPAILANAVYRSLLPFAHTPYVKKSALNAAVIHMSMEDRLWLPFLQPDLIAPASLEACGAYNAAWLKEDFLYKSKRLQEMQGDLREIIDHLSTAVDLLAHLDPTDAAQCKEITDLSNEVAGCMTCIDRDPLGDALEQLDKIRARA